MSGVAQGLGAGGVGADEVVNDRIAALARQHDGAKDPAEAINGQAFDGTVARRDLQPAGSGPGAIAVQLDPRRITRTGLAGAVDRYRGGDGRQLGEEIN